MGGTRFAGGELGRWMLVALILCCRCRSSSRASSPSQVNAAGERVVTHLPGFQGPLPFDLRTGYVEVDERNGVRLFYFTPSERSPDDDPVMLWLSGGPGCTSFTGLVYQIGPLKFDDQGYTGGLPKLMYRSGPRKWFDVHPEFLSNPLYIGGDSYSGMIVPTVTSEIIAKGNNAGSEPALNLKGYLVGNPITDVNFDEPSKIPYAHRMGLISDQIYEAYKKSCSVGDSSHRSSTQCTNSLDAIQKAFGR